MFGNQLRNPMINDENANPRGNVPRTGRRLNNRRFGTELPIINDENARPRGNLMPTSNLGTIAFPNNRRPLSNLTNLQHLQPTRQPTRLR